MRISSFFILAVSLLLLAVARADNENLAPDTWTPLLDAELSHWELWMGVPLKTVEGLPEGTPTSGNGISGTPLGLGNDPKQVYSMRIEDDEPVLAITGEIFGGLTTLKTFSNYHFRTQFKWGEKKWEPKLEAPRDNGILFHCNGQHGFAWKVWKQSVEFQVEENGMGDLYCISGTSARLPAEKGEKKWHYDPSGKIKSFGNIPKASGGSALRLPGDFEKPNGEWNTLELYAFDRAAVYLVNGKVVQVLHDIGRSDNPEDEPQALTEGQIQIQSEGAECYYRRMEIRPITEIPVEFQVLETPQVASPDGNVSLTFQLDEDGKPGYSISYKGEPLLMNSELGLSFKGRKEPAGGFSISESRKEKHDETWFPVAGERSEIRDHHNELVVDLKSNDSSRTRLQLKFRVFDEGAAFCYVIPEQAGMEEFTIAEELSQFRFAGNHFCWDTKDPQEVYRRVPISEAGDNIERPLVVEVGKSPFVALGEARLVDYARLRFNTPAANTFGIKLGSDVVAKAPYTTPWRYVMIGDSPGDLLENNDLIPNLNDPCAIKDTSWIKPGKVIRTELNTEVAKETIDWAVKMNASYILLDAGWYGNEMDDNSDATTITVDPKRFCGPLDMQAVIDYGKKHDIGIILYVNHRALEKQLDELLPLFQKWGVAGIKFGFVQIGTQEATKWVHDAVKKCADYKMIVDIHDDYRPTGWSRTYPNLLTQEGVHGNEEMPTAKDNVLLPFTRFLCGPADYTVCYYSSRIQSTRAHQLAASIVYFSPIQLIFWYDKPSQFKNEPELDVFKQVPTTWDDTKVLHGEMEKYVSIARRSGDKWFVGTMNAGEPRKLEIKLDFLKPGVKYTANIKSDGHPDGSDPKKVANTTKTVTSESVLTADMAANGGQAIILTSI